jgi:hypothetical protein
MWLLPLFCGYIREQKDNGMKVSFDCITFFVYE